MLAKSRDTGEAARLSVSATHVNSCLCGLETHTSGPSTVSSDNNTHLPDCFKESESCIRTYLIIKEGDVVNLLCTTETQLCLTAIVFVMVLVRSFINIGSHSRRRTKADRLPSFIRELYHF